MEDFKKKLVEHFEEYDLISSSNITDEMIWFNPDIEVGLSGNFEYGIRGSDHEELHSMYESFERCINKNYESVWNEIHKDNWYRIVPETKTILKSEEQENIKYKDFKNESYIKNGLKNVTNSVQKLKL